MCAHAMCVYSTTDISFCLLYHLATQPAIRLDTQHLVLFSDIFEITVHLFSKHLDEYVDN